MRYDELPRPVVERKWREIWQWLLFGPLPDDEPKADAPEPEQPRVIPFPKRPDDESVA